MVGHLPVNYLNSMCHSLIENVADLNNFYNKLQNGTICIDN